MTRQEYLEFHKKCCDEMVEITKRKNADYSGASETDDPFANFRVVEHIGICNAETGFLTRMSDKLSRIATFVKKGELQVKDEQVDDTLKDLANYCILMLGYVRAKESDRIQVTEQVSHRFENGADIMTPCETCKHIKVGLDEMPCMDCMDKNYNCKNYNHKNWEAA